MTGRICLVALAAGLAVAFAGCDGDGPSPQPPTAPAPPPAPPPPPEPPPAPTGLRVSATTPDSITWTWNPAPDAFGYVVQVSLDEVWTDEDAIVETAETSFTVTRLDPETHAYLRVAAAAGTADAPLLSAWTTHVTGMSAGPPEAQTWIGFANPLRGSVFEGGRVRAVVLVGGELLRSPLRLTVERDAPADQLVVPEEIEIEAYGHGAVEIVGLVDRRSEAAGAYRITLVPPPEGLPSRVALAEGATTYRVTLNDGDRDPGCDRLELDATGEDFDSRGGFSTARITLEGPRNVGLRIHEPYWDDRLLNREEPPDLPIEVSEAPPITLAIPTSLPYQGLAGGGRRQQISLSWYDDLRMEAVAPGCPPATLRCPERTIRTQGCQR